MLKLRSRSTRRRCTFHGISRHSGVFGRSGLQSGRILGAGGVLCRDRLRSGRLGCQSLCVNLNNGARATARIAIKAKGRVLFVNPLDVTVAKAEGNYVALVHKSGAYLVRETMASTTQKLASFGFVRIHRSILVNTALVKDLRRDNTGTYVLRTIDGRDHPVGRAYKRNLKMIAGSWLGVEIV